MFGGGMLRKCRLPTILALMGVLVGCANHPPYKPPIDGSTVKVLLVNEAEGTNRFAYYPNSRDCSGVFFLPHKTMGQVRPQAVLESKFPADRPLTFGFLYYAGFGYGTRITLERCQLVATFRPEVGYTYELAYKIGGTGADRRCFIQALRRSDASGAIERVRLNMRKWNGDWASRDAQCAVDPTIPE